jgi:hypothetical protein
MSSRRVIYLCTFFCALSSFAFAQNADTTAGKVDAKQPELSTGKKSSATDKPASDEKKPAMVQQATLNNLQMTVTGNQEQPRVLYILPWQSPATTDVDFEPLDAEQKAVFNHVEREELRRELESVGEGE